MKVARVEMRIHLAQIKLTLLPVRKRNINYTAKESAHIVVAPGSHYSPSREGHAKK
jgi:alpha-glucuronidase